MSDLFKKNVPFILTLQNGFRATEQLYDFFGEKVLTGAAYIDAILSEKAPEKKKTFIERSKELNLRFMAFIGRHPFLFAVILLLLNQGLSSSINGGAGITDLPPDFPF